MIKNPPATVIEDFDENKAKLEMDGKFIILKAFSQNDESTE